ncbi:hypothetical protein [Paenibacillus sp. Soil724D2]|uniref:hypothetical protein n=1 Tax=Paenibacillus sp. (strain Soil724D2) TaxID=1736392 RepID=UPI000B13955F|nr:hypothetical protein [Paenibacillus sp. Soil724D2]
MMNAAAMIGNDSCPIEGFVPDEVNAFLVKRGLQGNGGEDGISAMIACGYVKS